MVERTRRVSTNFMFARFHSSPVRTYMPAKTPRARKGNSVKEYHLPAPTRKPINLDVYGGKFVAIRRRIIIDSDDDLTRLIRRMKRKGLLQQVAFLGLPRPGEHWV